MGCAAFRGMGVEKGLALLAKIGLPLSWLIQLLGGLFPVVGAFVAGILEKLPAKVREIAWKAQMRLTARYRALAGRGKRTTVVCTAIARELVGFMWSVAHEVEVRSA